MHHLTLNVVHAVSPAGCEPNDLPKRATLPLKASAQEEKTKGKVGKTNKVAPPQKYAANMEGLSLDELNDAPAHIAIIAAHNAIMSLFKHIFRTFISPQGINERVRLN